MTPDDLAAIKADIARMPKPSEAIPQMSWYGLFGVACRLAEGADALLAEVERLRGALEDIFNNTTDGSHAHERANITLWPCD